MLKKCAMLLILVNPDKPWRVSKDNILYKCRWSPLEGTQFKNRIEKTFVNGQLVFDKGIIYEEIKGKQYFRFSGKIDTVHLTGENNKLICGKPGLSSNYAKYKPHGELCKKCLEGINNAS